MGEADACAVLVTKTEGGRTMLVAVCSKGETLVIRSFTSLSRASRVFFVSSVPHIGYTRVDTHWRRRAMAEESSRAECQKWNFRSVLMYVLKIFSLRYDDQSEAGWKDFAFSPVSKELWLAICVFSLGAIQGGLLIAYLNN